MTKKKDDGPGSAEGKADAGAAPAPDSQNLDDNQKPNPPTLPVPPPPSIEELNAAEQARLATLDTALNPLFPPEGEVPAGAPVWEGGDPGVATKAQDDTPPDYYWPAPEAPPPETLAASADNDGDQVPDDVVLDDPVNAVVGPGEPDPSTQPGGDGESTDDDLTLPTLHDDDEEE